MSLTINDAIGDLVAASHILAMKQVVDGFGHVSMRHPTQPGCFLISRSMAPALVTESDIMMVDFNGDTLGDDDRPAFLERFIHAAIYAARSDVKAVVHSHSPSVIPFGVVKSVPLRPVYHMCGFLGDCSPIFEIRESAGDHSDLLVRSIELGQALADALGGSTTILMRGHGSVVVASTLPQAVYRAVYLEINARIQMQALQLGPVNFLNVEEAQAADAVNEAQIGRAWKLWLNEIGR